MDPTTKNSHSSFLSTCDSCVSPSDKSIIVNERHRYYTWACQLQCQCCSSSWFVCSICPSSRKRLKTNRQLSSHNYIHNKRLVSSAMENSSTTCAAYLVEHSSNITDQVELPSCDIQFNTPAFAFCGPPVMNFTGIHNINYFTNQLKDLGAAYIVSYSQFKLPNVAAEMDDVDVKFHLAVASLLTQITSGQRKQLAEVLKLAAEVMERKMSDNCKSSSWHTQLPLMPSLMRSFYMEGKYAMLPNLPRPPVYIYDDHACTRLKDCVADLLGHGFLLDYIQPSNDHATKSCNDRIKLSESIMAHNILCSGRELHGETPFYVFTLLSGVMHLNHQFQPSLTGALFG